jgi:hypothetical protein
MAAAGRIHTGACWWIWQQVESIFLQDMLYYPQGYCSDEVPFTCLASLLLLALLLLQDVVPL